MPYANIDALPKQVKKYPKNIQKLFLKVFNKVWEQTKGDEQKTFRITWSIIKKHLRNKRVVHKSLRFVPTHFRIGKNDDSPTLIDFIMSGEKLDAQHQKMSRSLLSKFIDEVHNKKVFGTIEHSTLNPAETDPLLKQPILEVVNAELVNNELFGTARLLNHPYKQQVLQAIKDGVLNGISVEVLLNSNDLNNNVFTNGNLVGISLVHDPSYDNARVFRIRQAA